MQKQAPLVEAGNHASCAGEQEGEQPVDGVPYGNRSAMKETLKLIYCYVKGGSG